MFYFLVLRITRKAPRLFATSGVLKLSSQAARQTTSSIPHVPTKTSAFLRTHPLTLRKPATSKKTAERFQSVRYVWLPRDRKLRSNDVPRVFTNSRCIPMHSSLSNLLASSQRNTSTEDSIACGRDPTGRSPSANRSSFTDTAPKESDDAPSVVESTRWRLGFCWGYPAFIFSASC